MICPTCGTENREPSKTCFFCGAVLPVEPPALEIVEPAPPPPSLRPAPPSRPASRDYGPDFVGLFGVAFFLIVVGVVFYVNPNLLEELRRWWDQILAGRLLQRPPEGVITSAALFWALLGLTSFAIAGLRWAVTRSKLRTLGASLGGIGMIAFAYLLYRYSRGESSGSLVISFEAAVIGVLLIVYIASGLYWTATRRRAALAEARRPVYRP